MKKIIQITTLLGAFAFGSANLNAAVMPGSSTQLNNSSLANISSNQYITLVTDLRDAFMSGDPGAIAAANNAFQAAQLVSASMTNDSLIFSPNPGNLTLTNQVGSFVGFNAAEISSLTSFQPNFGLDSESTLIDFGASSLATADAMDTFHVDGVNYQVYADPLSSLTSISVTADGFFRGFGGGDDVYGEAVITMQTAQDIATVNDILDSGGTLQALSFSGAVISPVGSNARITPVPEPSTIALFGVAFVGLGFIGYRKRQVA